MTHPETTKLLRVCAANNYRANPSQDGKSYYVEGMLQIFPLQKRYKNLASGYTGAYRSITGFLPAVISRMRDDRNPMFR